MQIMSTQTFQFSLDTIHLFPIHPKTGDRIFLRGDLGAGKTTLSKQLINAYLGRDTSVRSPTYVYYNKYENLYHFDLYRLSDYEEFVNIGGEEIFEDSNNIIIVEWPELIESRYPANIDISLSSTEDEKGERTAIVRRS